MEEVKTVKVSESKDFLLQLKIATNERLVEIFQIFSHKKLKDDLFVQFKMLKEEYKLRTDKSM